MSALVVLTVAWITAFMGVGIVAGVAPDVKSRRSGAVSQFDGCLGANSAQIVCHHVAPVSPCAAISENDQTRSDTPASIAGVTRSVL